MVLINERNPGGSSQTLFRWRNLWLYTGLHTVIYTVTSNHTVSRHWRLITGKSSPTTNQLRKIPACRCTLPMLILRMNVVVMRIVIECYGDLFLRVSQLKRLVMMNWFRLTGICIHGHSNVWTGELQLRSFCLICVIKFVQVIYCNLPNSFIYPWKLLKTHENN